VNIATKIAAGAAAVLGAVKSAGGLWPMPEFLQDQATRRRRVGGGGSGAKRWRGRNMGARPANGRKLRRWVMGKEAAK